jgi:AcrR family transcriptional regulator
MARAALSESELEAFREVLLKSAVQLFAEHGYEGVTMRALAAELGCSPMTPYRYFKNKAEIFQAVQTAAFERFANALEDAYREDHPHHERLRALCWAYVNFALAEPHAYRIMFELDPAQRPALRADADLRSWKFMHKTVEDAVAAGVLVGDPDVLAHLLWSSVHGLVALHLSGMLIMGRQLHELIEAMLERQYEVSKAEV